jgi:hypothetical protein
MRRRKLVFDKQSPQTTPENDRIHQYTLHIENNETSKFKLYNEKKSPQAFRRITHTRSLTHYLIASEMRIVYVFIHYLDYLFYIQKTEFFLLQILSFPMM